MKWFDYFNLLQKFTQRLRNGQAQEESAEQGSRERAAATAAQRLVTDRSPAGVGTSHLNGRCIEPES